MLAPLFLQRGADFTVQVADLLSIGENRQAEEELGTQPNRCEWAARRRGVCSTY